MCSLPLHQVGPLIHGAVLLRPNFGFGPRLLDPAIMCFRTKRVSPIPGTCYFWKKRPLPGNTDTSSGFGQQTIFCLSQVFS